MERVVASMKIRLDELKLGDENPIIKYTKGLPPNATNKQIKKALKNNFIKPVEERLYVLDFEDMGITRPIERLHGYKMYNDDGFKIGVELKLLTDLTKGYWPHKMKGGNLKNQIHYVGVMIKKSGEKRYNVLVQPDVEDVMDMINRGINQVQWRFYFKS